VSRGEDRICICCYVSPETKVAVGGRYETRNAMQGEESNIYVSASGRLHKAYKPIW
jgi:hypothetical protein